MDHIDIQLLELLQKDSRMTVSDLSKELALSRPSVTERMHRLQEKGIIEQFTTRVSLQGVGREILLIILVGSIKVSIEEFESFIKQEKDVMECHRVTGEVSYFIKAAVPNMNSMRLLIDRLIPYGQINTSTVLASPVQYRPILPSENLTN